MVAMRIIELNLSNYEPKQYARKSKLMRSLRITLIGFTIAWLLGLILGVLIARSAKPPILPVSGRQAVSSAAVRPL
jgi:hypothetical protein